MRRAIELGLLNTFSYLILTVDFRSVAQANKPVAVAVNVVIGWFTVVIIQRVASAKTKAETIAYMAAAGLGTWLGITISQAILGH